MDKNIPAQREAEDFLERYAMGYRRVDILKCAQEFLSEMDRSIRGGGGSLRMIPSYFSPVTHFENEKPVLALDAGGTNLRAAVIRFDRNGTPLLEKFRCAPMPGIQSRITADEFFDQVARFIRPLLPESSKIAFCFSYASRPTPDQDGIAEEMGKQLKVIGMEGRSLAHGLSDALKRDGCRDEKRIIVLNDSVSTLLGGVSSSCRRPFGSYIGFILGTGLNASYVENSDRFTGIRGKTGGQIIVNTESGNYDRFPRGKLDEAYDETLLDTGKWQFEKMVSGRFQGGLLHAVLRQAAADGLFSDGFGKLFSDVQSLTARQIDDFLDFSDSQNPLVLCCPDTRSDDALRLYFLINALSERAAKFVTANLAALLIRSESGRNPLCPVCITADGSTFYKSKLFRDKLDYYMRAYVGDRLGLHWEFHKVENVNLIGAAVAGSIRP